MLCYIFLSVEHTLVLWILCYIGLRSERTLVLWNVVVNLSARGMCSCILKFCVVFFCVWNTLRYCGIYCYIYLHVERALVFVIYFCVWNALLFVEFIVIIPACGEHSSIVECCVIFF